MINKLDRWLMQHPDVLAYRDLNEEAEEEVEASKYNLNFIKVIRCFFQIDLNIVRCYLNLFGFKTNIGNN